MNNDEPIRGYDFISDGVQYTFVDKPFEPIVLSKEEIVGLKKLYGIYLQKPIEQ